MAEIIKIYKQSVPKMRFIGKKYGDSDRVGGGFGKQWGEWFQNGWFDAIENAAGGAHRTRELYEDGDAYLGYMRFKEGEAFQYWIGMFTECGTPAPDGFDLIDIEAASLGTCWVYGTEPDIYGNEQKCCIKLENAGYKVSADDDGAFWFFERYGCPRFTTPDDKGNIILDICHYIKE